MTTALHSVCWPLRSPPRDYVLGHVRAVLPDRVLDDARVVVRDGLIAEVGPHPAVATSDVDGNGLFCLPGLVDVHSDGLERERMPRPNAELPWEFALVSFEGKLRAAGVTTVYHGAAFGNGGTPGGNRSVDSAVALCRVVDERGPAPVDHRILHRLDVRCSHGVAALHTRLSTLDHVAVVSHEDHTPGQGQYADRSYFERYVMGTQGLTAEQARRHVDELIVRRDALLSVRDDALRWLGDTARAETIRLLGHDPVTAAEIDTLAARGGTVAEFPTTLDAASAARDRGMGVVGGAPNVLRGGSHAGNVAARELVARGLLTALASDYLPSGLLAAAFLLADDGVTTLPSAVALVTAGAAEAVGLADRGRLVPGLRADLVLVQQGGRWPVVRATLRAEPE